MSLSSEEQQQKICVWDDYDFTGDDTSSVRNFKNTDVIKRVHNVSPRWGHTSNINVLLLSDNDDSKESYIKGILGTAIAIVVFVILWLLILFILKRLGAKRVGIFSGTPIYKKHVVNNEETGEIIIENEKNITLLMARITVLLCSIGITVCVILLLYYGVRNLRNAADDTQNTIGILEDITDQAINLIRDFIQQQGNAINVTKDFFNFVNTELCPKQNFTLCENIDNITTCDFNNNLLDTSFTNDDIENLRTIISSKVSNNLDNAIEFETDLMKFKNDLNTAYEKSDDFNWAFAVAAGFAIFYVILLWIICYGVVAVWLQFNNENCFQRTLRCFRHWIIVPIFILCLIISLLFSVVFIMGSYVSSDLCYNDPTIRIELILQKNSDYIDPTLLGLAKYYINGCKVNTYPPIFQEHIEKVSVIVDDIKQFISNIKNETIITSDDITNINGNDRYLQNDNSIFDNCGTNITLLSELGNTIENTFCGIGNLLYDVFRFFSCQNWRPLYETLVYEAICYNANDGLYYTAITQIAVVIMALIMLTMRAAFFDVPEEEAAVAAANEQARAAAAAAPAAGNNNENFNDEPNHEAPPPQSAVVEDYGLSTTATTVPTSNLTQSQPY